MILELTIITPKGELLSPDLLANLNRATNGFSVVVVLPTKIIDNAYVTPVRFGAGNKRKVLVAVRASGLKFTRIRRSDPPRPRLRSREVNGSDGLDT